MFSIFKRKKSVEPKESVPEIDLTLDEKYNKELAILKNRIVLENESARGCNYSDITDKIRNIYHILLKYDEFKNAKFDSTDINEKFVSLEVKENKLREEVLYYIKLFKVDEFWKGTSLSTFKKILNVIEKNGGDGEWLKKQIDKCYDSVFMTLYLKFIDE
jgi:hypothetical protein